ncbi:MAG TPA: phosphoribosylanthranilate isomerase [Xylanibacter oryzae]|uniref:phosphoribosylanthranilate isomerase n=1 Tax=Xylanibacter oryzae TaxID=185293 RepID=UPI0004AE2055|nr:phosphoribosylanthranilate isomerase [Xylanibacter oryzae]HRN16002.1 phosphoribosylanthranilate isomerase [Xylanibacter oryzae]
MIIKVCGMRDSNNIRQVVDLGVDWIGFIFYPKSSRYVSMKSSSSGLLPDIAINYDCNKLSTHKCTVKKVGVFVDDTAQNIITRVVNYDLDIIQLHGSETPTLIRNLRSTLDPDIHPDIQFIKAISVKAPRDIDKYKLYEKDVDYFLFDTKCETIGGSGKHFDWEILKLYDGEKPFLLSGGIKPEDVEKIKLFNHPKCIGIDLNSNFEISPALKDIQSLSKFITEIKK